MLWTAKKWCAPYYYEYCCKNCFHKDPILLTVSESLTSCWPILRAKIGHNITLTQISLENKEMGYFSRLKVQLSWKAALGSKLSVINLLRGKNNGMLLESLCFRTNKTRGLINYGSVLWNNLPLPLRQAKNIDSSKHLVKTHLFSSYFYP